jgi:ABC-type transporter Mla subunit MlaD
MTDARHSAKVGAFAIAAIILLAALLLSFSRTYWFTPTDPLRLHAETSRFEGVRPCLPGAAAVVGTELAPDGKGVTILLRIDKRYTIYSDAEFVVEQIGLLGDQYVVVCKNQAPW